MFSQSSPYAPRGNIDLFPNIDSYLRLCQYASDKRVPRFGNGAVGICLAGKEAGEAAPGGSDEDKTQATQAPWLNPSVALTVDHAVSLIDHGRDNGLALSEFNVGKFSVYPPNVWPNRASYTIDGADPTTWAYDSLRRLSNDHYHSAEAWKLCVVIAVFTDQAEALRAEQAVAENLGNLAGVVSMNTLPYASGRRSSKGSHFAIYLQAR